tara:strand:+ start:116 stop:481 length:366 start_codon:yes stop_codon:yes gene_type:complete
MAKYIQGILLGVSIMLFMGSRVVEDAMGGMPGRYIFQGNDEFGAYSDTQEGITIISRFEKGEKVWDKKKMKNVRKKEKMSWALVSYKQFEDAYHEQEGLRELDSEYQKEKRALEEKYKKKK